MTGNNLTSTNTAMHGNMFSIYRNITYEKSHGGKFGKYQDSSSYTKLKKINAIRDSINKTNYSDGGNKNTIHKSLQRVRNFGTVPPKKYNNK
jgi:hypothetical protein|tara:strand:- start:89 stop:364 length:276 start_codon:yes stop_codon:yes gene_type:complete